MIRLHIPTLSRRMRLILAGNTLKLVGARDWHWSGVNDSPFEVCSLPQEEFVVDDVERVVRDVSIVSLAFRWHICDISPILL